MASESVNILIEAEDNATAVLKSTTAAVEKTATAAKSAGSEMSKMASVQDDVADMTAELDEMGDTLGDVATRTDALAEKTVSWAGKLGKVAGAVGTVIATFTGAVAVGKRIGEWIFQTDQLLLRLKDFDAQMLKVGQGNIARDSTVIDRQIELAKLTKDPKQQDAEIGKIREDIEAQLITTGKLVQKRKEEKKDIDASRTALESEKLEAATLLKIEEDRLEMLSRQHAKISEDTREYEKQKAAKIQANKDEVDNRKALARMIKFQAQDEAAGHAANKKAEEEFIDQILANADAAEKADKKAEKAFIDQVVRNADAVKKEDAAREARAKKAISVEAKLRADAYAEQNVPGLSATEGRLLTGSSADPQQKVVVNTQKIVDYMAAEQAKLDAMVDALEASTNPTYNILP